MSGAYANVLPFAFTCFSSSAVNGSPVTAKSFRPLTKFVAAVLSWPEM